MQALTDQTADAWCLKYPIDYHSCPILLALKMPLLCTRATNLWCCVSNCLEAHAWLLINCVQSGITDGSMMGSVLASSRYDAASFNNARHSSAVESALESTTVGAGAAAVVAALQDISTERVPEVWLYALLPKFVLLAKTSRRDECFSECVVSLCGCFSNRRVRYCPAKPQSLTACRAKSWLLWKD